MGRQQQWLCAVRDNGEVTLLLYKHREGEIEFNLGLLHLLQSLSV